MIHPIRTLIYKIRNYLEKRYFYKKRPINEYWYNSDEDVWEKTEEKWLDHAEDVIGNWFDGEWSILNMIELKLAHIFYKIKKDGIHSYWYIDSFRGMVSKKDHDTLLVKGFIDRFFNVRKKDAWLYNDLYLTEKDDFHYRLKMYLEKPGVIDVNLEKYHIEKVPTKKPYAYSMEFKNFDKRKELIKQRQELKAQRNSFLDDETKSSLIDSLNAQIDSLTEEIKKIHLADDSIPIMEKEVRVVDSSTYIETIHYEPKSRKFFGFKGKYFEDYTGKQYTFYKDSSNDILNLVKHIQKVLDEQEIKCDVAEEFLNDFQTVNICPSLYVLLDKNTKARCRGRRQDLKTVLAIRRKVLNILKINDTDDEYNNWMKLKEEDYSNLTDDEFKKLKEKTLKEDKARYAKKREEAYVSFAKLCAKELENVWD